MRIHYILSFFLFLTAGNSFAQNGYVPSFIIQNKDTISGFIERETEAILSKSIKFKTNQDTEHFTAYTPTDITGFGFTTDSIWFEAVDADILKDTSSTKVKRFAKILLKGPTSLYKLQLLHTEYTPILLRDNTYVYILQKGGKYFTLGQNEFSVENAVGVNKRYIGMLTYVFRDCPNVLSNISTLKFRDQPILELVQEYNACTNSHITNDIYTYKVKPVIRHGIELSYATYLSSIEGTAYLIGYFIDTYKPDVSKKISATLGLSYYYSKHGLATYLSEPNVVTHAIRIPLALQLNPGSSHLAAFLPFLNIGLTQYVSAASDEIDFLSVPTLGGGFYARSIKLACTLENLGFLSRSPTRVQFTIGVRLDKRQD